jgi:hypothetical protein
VIPHRRQHSDKSSRSLPRKLLERNSPLKTGPRFRTRHPNFPGLSQCARHANRVSRSPPCMCLFPQPTLPEFHHFLMCAKKFGASEQQSWPNRGHAYFLLQLKCSRLLKHQGNYLHLHFRKLPTAVTGDTQFGDLATQSTQLSTVIRDRYSGEAS